MEMKNPKISYRETITGKAEADYRHKNNLVELDNLVKYT